MDYPGWTILSDTVGDARAAALGYTVRRKPTPASDSVKGEVDKFGRPIIERLGGAFIVKAGGGFMVSRPDGLWWDGGQWHDETNPHNPWATNIAESQTLLPSAAKSLELPTANPAASAKVEQNTEDMCDYIDGACCNCGDSEFGIGPNTCANLDRLRGNVACGAVAGPLASIIEHIASLKREVAELRKARQ